jgi:hypothetical protein
MLRSEAFRQHIQAMLLLALFLLAHFSRVIAEGLQRL